MMARYKPRHDTQYEPRTKASPYDCNMAASADALRFWSLGLKDRNHDQLRHDSGTYWEVVDNNPDNNGTNITDAAHALSENGVPSTVYDANDGKSYDDVRASLLTGVVIAHGDYDQVPSNVDGELAPNFNGTHSVLFHSLTGSGVLVGDGLSEKWLEWPHSVAKAYMAKFPGAGMTYLVVRPRKLCAKVPTANVYADHDPTSRDVGNITPRSRIMYGGTVLGSPIRSNRVWYRVWFNGRIAYVHSTVAKPV